MCFSLVTLVFRFGQNAKTYLVSLGEIRPDSGMKHSKIILAGLFVVLMIVGLSQSVSAADAKATLSSREINNATTNIGLIVIGGTQVGPGGTFPFSTVIFFGIAPITYSLTYIAAWGYDFVKWEISGSITVGDINAVDTTATISGDDATLTAVYAPDRPVIDSQWTNNPPSIDGVFGLGEWSNLQLHLVPNDYPIDAYVYVLNDASNLYFVVDAAGDMTNDAGDECLLVFNFAPMHPVEVIGAGGTVISSGFLAAVGYGTSPNEANQHKIYEFSIPFTYIGKQPGDSIDFSSPLQEKFVISSMHYFASMPFDITTYHDNVWPATLGGSYTEVNYWGILNTQRQSSHAPEGPNLHVGGELFTANKVAVLSPYLAFFSVIAVAAVAMKTRRRAQMK